MKNNKIGILIMVLIVLSVSCDEPETTVTDFVRPDGSVRRRIEMKSKDKKMDKPSYQVPFDSTWKITDSLSVSAKSDTIWFRKAEKDFDNIAEINSSYLNDTTANGKFRRHAGFRKEFRWFNTKYRFSETIDKNISTGISIEEFLNERELRYFYSPENLKYNMEHGADSLKYKALSDTINKKVWHWSLRNITDLWISEFARFTDGRSGPELSAESLRKKEQSILGLLDSNKEKFDSLWKNGFFQQRILGEENGRLFRHEADSALDIAVNKFLVDFRDYSVRIVMPGKLTATNGFIDSTKNLIWPVNSDLFMTDQYEMWAESKTTNIWAWVLSFIFVVFVFTGMVISNKSRTGRDL